MKFGRTTLQVYNDSIDERYNPMNWKKYAWIPVKIQDGTWIWFEEYYSFIPEHSGIYQPPAVNSLSLIYVLQVALDNIRLPSYTDNDSHYKKWKYELEQYLEKEVLK